MNKMDIINYKVEISRLYTIEIDDSNRKDISPEYIKLKALSQFNNDLQFGLISANEDDFKCEIKYDWME